MLENRWGDAGFVLGLELELNERFSFTEDDILGLSW